MELQGTRNNNRYFQVLTWILILFPISSVVNTILPFSLNRLLVVLFFGLTFIVEYLSKKRKYFVWVVALYLILLFLITSINSGAKFNENFSDFIYFALTLIVFLQMADKQYLNGFLNEINKTKKLFSISIVVALLLLAIASFNPSSYESDGAFKAFTVSSHAVASTCVFMFAVIVFFKIKNPIHIIGCTYFLFISMARTFLIPYALLLYLYINRVVAQKKIRWLIYVIILMVFVCVFPNTSMYQKFVDKLNNPYANDIWDGLTSGRSEFWKVDIECYLKKLNLFEKIFGYSFSLVKDVNYEATGHRIWAHNDFINILIAGGGVGVVIYCYSFVYSLKTISKKVNKIFLVLFVVGPAALNGFYMYYGLVLSVIFIYIILSDLNDDRLKHNK